MPFLYRIRLMARRMLHAGYIVAGVCFSRAFWLSGLLKNPGGRKSERSRCSRTGLTLIVDKFGDADQEPEKDGRMGQRRAAAEMEMGTA